MTAQRDWHSEPEQQAETTGWPNLGLHDKAGPLRLTIVTLGGLIILGVVLYGLNKPHAENEINASRPAPATTTGQSK